VHVAALALVIPDLSKWLPLALLLRGLTPRRPNRLYAGMTREQILPVIQYRLRAPWRMRGRRCLRRGLLTFYFLRLAGIPAVLNFGVYHAGRTRELAHCWVTVDGRCVADPPQQACVLILVHGDAEEAEWPDSQAAA
jgi:hypothetical protein